MTKKTEAVVILSDWQCPLDDTDKIKRVADFIGDFQPIALGHVGDLTDSTQISRWTKGLRGEFDGGLEAGFQKTRDLIEYHRKKYDGPWHVMRSNHEDRLSNAIEQRLPGLAGITVDGKLLNIQNALQFDRFDITYHETPFEIAPNWILAHGDEGQLSQVPGMTAMKLANEMHRNVVAGHSHRAALVWTSKGVNGERKAFAGMEVGHMMKLDDAEYLGPARLNNWGNAFGILWLNGVTDEVFPQLVPINPDGHFMVNGERY